MPPTRELFIKNSAMGLPLLTLLAWVYMTTLNILDLRSMFFDLIFNDIDQRI